MATSMGLRAWRDKATVSRFTRMRREKERDEHLSPRIRYSLCCCYCCCCVLKHEPIAASARRKEGNTKGKQEKEEKGKGEGAKIKKRKKKQKFKGQRTLPIKPKGEKWKGETGDENTKRVESKGHHNKTIDWTPTVRQEKKRSHWTSWRDIISDKWPKWVLTSTIVCLRYVSKVHWQKGKKLFTAVVASSGVIRIEEIVGKRKDREIIGKLTGVP